MVVGGYEGIIDNGGAMDDVELVSLDPILQPLPECLTELNPTPVVLTDHVGALDYSGESGFQE